MSLEIGLRYSKLVHANHFVSLSGTGSFKLTQVATGQLQVSESATNWLARTSLEHRRQYLHNRPARLQRAAQRRRERVRLLFIFFCSG